MLDTRIVAFALPGPNQPLPPFGRRLWAFPTTLRDISWAMKDERNQHVPSEDDTRLRHDCPSLSLVLSVPVSSFLCLVCSSVSSPSSSLRQLRLLALSRSLSSSSRVTRRNPGTVLSSLGRFPLLSRLRHSSFGPDSQLG